MYVDPPLGGPAGESQISLTRRSFGIHFQYDVVSVRLALRSSGHEVPVSEAGAATQQVSGGFGVGETPDPIPNSAVKPYSVDGTASAKGWESRSPPGVI